MVITNLRSDFKGSDNKDDQSASKRTLMKEKVHRKRLHFKSSLGEEGKMQFLKLHNKHVSTKSTFRLKNEIKKKKHRRRQKKMKAFDLSALSESLPDLNLSLSKKKSTMIPRQCHKHKSKIADILRVELGEILQNPYFQSDPLGSIHEHLMQTQPKEKSEKKPSQKHKKKQKKNKSKTATMSVMDTS